MDIKTLSSFLQPVFKKSVNQTSTSKTLNKGRCPWRFWHDPEERPKNNDWEVPKGMVQSDVSLLSPYWQSPIHTLRDNTIQF